jgi:perosamine synthetase
MRKILAAKPSITQLEIDYVNDAISNGWGEHCYDYINKFKTRVKEYFGSEFVWPTSSCHGALHMVLMALGFR